MIRTLHWRPIVGLVLTLAGCNASAPLAEGTRPVRAATVMGAGVRVASYVRFDEQCRQAALPEARPTQQPLHGTLGVRPAEIIAGGRRFSGSTDCRNKPFQGVELWYEPAQGFRGTDRMAYEVDAGQGVVSFSATVDVR